MNPQDRRLNGNLSLAPGTHARPNLRAPLALHHEGLSVQRKGVALRRGLPVRDEQPVDSPEYEQRHLLKVLDNIFTFVVVLAPDGTVVEANRTALEWAGIALADVAGEKFWDCCWWEDGSNVRSEIRSACERAAGGQPAQCRLTVRTILADFMSVDLKLAPIKDDLGITHVIVSGIDITENKKIEDAYRDISGRLICIQDEERRRIARELHDDLGQRMALLAIELEQLEQGVSKRSSQLHPRIRDLLVKTQQISGDILRLSHESHPSILDHLGLVAAVQGFCDELCRHHIGLKIEFRHQGVPTRLHADIRLSLFRIIQEALHNVVKHSGSTSASIVLEKTDQKIYLSVSDQGCGFETRSVKPKEGLGLISIRERTHLVGGRMSIKSQPSQGTQIEITVPLTGHA